MNSDELISLLSTSWRNVLDIQTKDFENIVKTLNSGKFYPKKEDIFNALNSCPPSKVKIVLIGQDPYINENEAHGFSFSVKNSVKIPPSLMNIFKELKQEFRFNSLPTNGCLTKIANEGVLLLNSILTVSPGKSNSHKNIGWEIFTKKVIEYLDLNHKIIFLCLGNQAREVCKCVTKNKVMCYGHPSPLNTAKPFVGCNCFKDVNNELINMYILPVRWNVLFD